jgi:hypothetical protein
MNGTQQQIIKRLRARSHLLRRILIILAILAIIVGLQSWLHLSKLGPMIQKANESFNYLVDERQNKNLSSRIMNALTELRSVSTEASWQSELDEIQSEFQGFINAPAEGLDVTINKITGLKDKTAQTRDVIDRIIRDLNRLNTWHQDYYGDIIATITGPGIAYWPASMIMGWFHDNTLLDTMQFNRGLYLVIMGEVSAGQAILGELRTRLPDSPLRARVLFSQGRLLYGMGRYEQSVEVVQQSVQMDPSHGLAKRFLEYQVSKGPDEEVEEEDEDVQRVGTASSGGATLF